MRNEVFKSTQPYQTFVFVRLKTTTTTETSATALQTTSRAPWPDSDMTFYVTSDEEKAFVDAGPDQQIGFAVGSHVILRGNCTINITVIHNGKQQHKWFITKFKHP
jgi:hypothetical protein